MSSVTNIAWIDSNMERFEVTKQLGSHYIVPMKGKMMTFFFVFSLEERLKFFQVFL